MADHDTAEALKRFFSDPETGMFHGPYVRCRLPYAQAENWERVLEWMPSWFTPYQHQAEAFRRLRSFDGEQDRVPEPTLVVTGTGSGKTEAFLYPIIDHARRMRARGQRGVKALLLYPMNALANDQLNRLEALFESDPELDDVSYGIYTGELTRVSRTRNGKRSTSKSRDTLQIDPPDILLTNYKMLDQLLLRPADREIWEHSATTLQYVVLDEFHTYDGAQGTDVALLLRRLGLMISAFQADDEKSSFPWPLGKITPVATSATLGAKGDDQPMLAFAETVFGRPFTSDCVVSETMVSLPQWQEEMAEKFGSPTLTSTSGMPDVDIVEAVLRAVDEGDGDEGERAFYAFCAEVWGCEPKLHSAIGAAAQHPLTEALLIHAASAAPLHHRDLDRVESLPNVVLGETARRVGAERAEQFITHALSAMSFMRSSLGKEDSWGGKRFPGVEVHMWLRELSRIDRATALPESGAMFRWSDDGPAETSHDQAPWLPACYCRICGRSGWMVKLDAGTNIPNFDQQTIRQSSIFNKDLQRALIDATPEQRYALAHDEPVTGPRKADDDASVMWLHTQANELSLRQPTEEEEDSLASIPVLTFNGKDASKLSADSTCPSCGETNAIRYVGSSVATLLSVSLSNLFGMPGLDRSEKKTLVFTDSVQDAAHRAGFVQSRSRTFALRTLTRKHVGSSGIRLHELAPLLVESAGKDNRARYGLLPPDIADYDSFRPFWSPEYPSNQRSQAKKNALARLEFDLLLEFGQRAHLARSLVSTGSLSTQVIAPENILMESARAAIASLGVFDFDRDSESLVPWAQGILEMIRLRGGLYHDWLGTYISHDANSYQLNRSQSRARGVPRFPPGGAPEFPRVSSSKLSREKDHGVSAVASPRGRYAQWTAQFLEIPVDAAARAMRSLLESLASFDILRADTTKSGGTVYSILPESVAITIEEDPRVLECEICHSHLAVASRVREELVDAPCLTFACSGRLRETPIEDNYYRKLYSATEPGTVIAREHTSLLDKDLRQGLEHAFRGTESDQLPNSPNVLVATPTLEMGIDIGDLSTVMLSSLPHTVASYVQRVGRAGRLTGNSLAFALVQGRGQTLPKLNEPLSIISGSVAPPAAFLSAVEILQRQLTAFIIDSTDIDARLPLLRTARDVFAKAPASQNLVDVLLERLDGGVDNLIDRFEASIARNVDDATVKDLRDWASGTGTSSLRSSLVQAQDDWHTERSTLRERKTRLIDRQAELDSVEDRDNDELEEERRTTRASLWHTDKLLKDLTDEHWVSSLERFGLLPNFTLLDDAVDLSVSVSKMDPHTQVFNTEVLDYRRGISTAIEELAPGAVFYAQGVAASIDSVEIGHLGSAIESWRLCPSCSYNEVDIEGPRPCPRCGHKGFADRGALLDVLPMKKVSAEVEQTKSAITDTAEDRTRVMFSMHVGFMVPEHVEIDQWFVQNGFGAQYLRTVDIRWLNLGRGSGEEREFASRRYSAPLFRVCRHCGHIDSAAGSNSRFDHRPWCTYRDKTEEDTVAFALARNLRTQGVLVYLPAKYTAGSDSLTMSSLHAAIRLGFKEVLGADPMHLNITTVKVPGDDRTVDALLIHDLVPGGTGYLKQFSRPADVRMTLECALAKLEECTCDDSERLCCPSCLLPYAPPRMIGSTSRETAIACIKDLLHPTGDDGEVVPWEVQETRPSIDESSALEIRFRTMLRDRLDDDQAQVVERNTAGVRTWDVTFRNGTKWRMTEQKNFGRTIPDFYFEPINHQSRALALYLDGAAYHVSDRHHRVRGDIAKRGWLASQHIQPFSLTSADLDRTTDGTLPSWLGGFRTAQGASQHLNMGPDDLDLVSNSQFDLLLTYLTRPTEPLWDKMAPFAALNTILSTTPEKTPRGLIMDYPGQGITMTATVVGGLPQPQRLFFDVPDTAVDLESWNNFLNLANLVWFSADYVDVTTESDVEPKNPEPTVASETERAGSIWEEIMNEYVDDDDVTPAIAILASAGAIQPDSIGDEHEGVPTVMAWTNHKVIIFFTAEDSDSAVETSLTTSGWDILYADTLTSHAIPARLLVGSKS
ncbi:DEAD/DEAH box helicase [Flaviflexus equikiangi]|uniref:DEAD/DEAH box helicase n=1 Tax=Flaviflexus equikiangi TaxID=2758573 RepID=UPI001C7135D3|nr:DEAD/DEAH box helicase [Flaviflexus equikiangi]